MNRSAPRAWWAHLPVWGGTLCALAWIAGLLTHRSNPWNGHPVVLPLLAAAMAVWVFGFRNAWHDRNQQSIALLLASLTAWLWAVDLWGPHSLPAGLWRAVERTAAVGVAVAMVAGRADSRRFLQHAAVMAVVICGLVVIAWSWQGIPSPTHVKTAFGFGHVNVVLTMSVPALLASGAWLVSRQMRGEHPEKWEWAALAAGAILVSAITWTLHRRGPLVALVSVPVFFLARLWWRRSRASFFAVAVILAAIGTWWLVTQGQDPNLASGRGLRLVLYQAAAKLAWQGMPWGLGDYGGLHLQWSVEPFAQYLTQVEWYLQLHNEVLDLTVAGGAPALVAVVILVVLIVRRIGSCTDPALADAAGVLIAAVTVHALTDNSYGQPAGTLWSAAVLGFLLVLPVQLTAPLSLPGPSWWALIAGPVAAWSVFQAAPMALLRAGAPLVQHERAHARYLHPETVYGELVQRMGISPVTTLPDLGAELASAIRRLGASDDLPWFYALSLRLTQGDVGERVHWVSTYLGAHPFATRAYGEMQELLGQQPELISLVSEPVLRRNALMAGSPGQSLHGDPRPPQTVAGLADVWAETVWLIRRGRRPDEMRTYTNALASASISHASVRDLLDAAARYGELDGATARGDQGEVQRIDEMFRTRWPWLLTVPNAGAARPPA